MSGRRWSHDGLKDTYAIVHSCSLYCSPEEGMHCQIFYASDDDPNGDVPRLLAQTMRQYHAADMVSCKPAPEAPPPDQDWSIRFYEHRPGSGDMTQTDAPDAEKHAWLVWFTGGRLLSHDERDAWEAMTEEERRAAWVAPGADDSHPAG